eukprot:Colp12_sorted_trinity150504_noHs@13234
MEDLGRIKEWHFHVYFDTETRDQALKFRSLLLEEVRQGNMFLVFNGVTAETHPRLSALNTERIPNFNEKPVGPHPVCSWENWVPQESLAKALSFFTLNRGDLTVFIHPLTRYELKDHTHRAFWLGKEYSLKLDVLQVSMPHITLSNMGYL